MSIGALKKQHHINNTNPKVAECEAIFKESVRDMEEMANELSSLLRRRRDFTIVENNIDTVMHK